MITILEPFRAVLDYNKSLKAVKMNLVLERCRIVVSYLVGERTKSFSLHKDVKQIVKFIMEFIPDAHSHSHSHSHGDLSIEPTEDKDCEQEEEDERDEADELTLVAPQAAEGGAEEEVPRKATVVTNTLSSCLS